MNTQTFAVPRWLRAAVFLLVAAASLAAAHAQNRIESVTGSVQAGTEVLRIDFSEPLASAPAGFAVQSPARIALDFRASAAAWAARPSTSARATCAR